MISESEIIELIKKAEETPTLDYKEDLPLVTDGDKAEFVKDVIALANSGEGAYILLGVEDKTGRLVGFKTHHTVEQLNQILKDKCDPPISVEYIEKNILGYAIGVIEIKCENPPYIVSVPDKFGGRLSANPQKSFHIHRGTVFVRNYNMNEGARRADLDRMHQVKYVTLQPDLELLHEVSVKSLDDLKEVEIDFRLINVGDVLATSVYARLLFHNIEKIVSTGAWQDISKYNEGRPTIRFLAKVPIYPGIPLLDHKVKVNVKKSIKQIEADLWLGAANMRIKEGTYVIAIHEST